VVRLVATVILLAKLAEVARVRGRDGFEMSVGWPVALVPWCVFDLSVAINTWRGWRAPWAPRLERLLQAGYTAGAGMPLGLVLKVLVGVELASGAVGSGVVAGVALACCLGLTVAMLCCALGARRRYRVALAVPAAYLAGSMANMVRVVAHDPDAVGLGRQAHDGASAFWAAFPDGSWLVVLTPVWAITAGGCVATVIDTVAVTRVAGVDAVARRRAMQRRLADALPLAGALGSGLMLAWHFDASDGSGASAAASVPLRCLLPLALCEMIGIINIVAMAVSTACCCSHDTGNNVDDQRGESKVPWVHPASRGILNAHAATTSNNARISGATDSGVAELRGSIDSYESLTDGERAAAVAAAVLPAGALSAATFSSSQKQTTRSVTAYGKPYIDNPAWQPTRGSSTMSIIINPTTVLSGERRRHPLPCSSPLPFLCCCSVADCADLVPQHSLHPRRLYVLPARAYHLQRGGGGAAGGGAVVCVCVCVCGGGVSWRQFDFARCTQAHAQ
jgi:hypothetical protein